MTSDIHGNRRGPDHNRINLIGQDRLYATLKPAILALVRQILTVAGTALVAKGVVQASDVEPVIGALLTIGSVIWSVADKRGRGPAPR